MPLEYLFLAFHRLIDSDLLAKEFLALSVHLDVW